jgi:hypothetical protein
MQTNDLMMMIMFDTWRNLTRTAHNYTEHSTGTFSGLQVTHAQRFLITDITASVFNTSNFRCRQWAWKSVRRNEQE